MTTRHTSSSNVWVPASKLASRFGVSRSTIYRMADAGLIPSIRVGPKQGVRRFKESEARQEIERCSLPQFSTEKGSTSDVTR
ncbi:MAG: helix-turn-helix domain-containing protein [Nitrospira sp.]